MHCACTKGSRTIENSRGLRASCTHELTCSRIVGPSPLTRSHVLSAAVLTSAAGRRCRQRFSAFHTNSGECLSYAGSAEICRRTAALRGAMSGHWREQCRETRRTVHRSQKSHKREKSVTRESRRGPLIIITFSFPFQYVRRICPPSFQL